MSEHDWAERFSRDLDRILAGEKVEMESHSGEYGRVIDLAIEMFRSDFSYGSGQDLKARIIMRINEDKEKNSSELNEEDLDKVAGGLRTIKIEDY
ncbi:MAG: hypothetical protein ACYDEQ_11285 [Desulfocucumaceae bacterium]